MGDQSVTLLNPIYEKLHCDRFIPYNILWLVMQECILTYADWFIDVYIIQRWTTFTASYYKWYTAGDVIRCIPCRYITPACIIDTVADSRADDVSDD